jgi:DNA-binding LacI/PurR family transcriptional regulator
MDGHPMGEFYGLSTIDQQTNAQGARGADMLVDILESGDDRLLNNVEQLTTWPIDLVVRSSTARQATS